MGMHELARRYMSGDAWGYLLELAWGEVSYAILVAGGCSWIVGHP